MTLRLDFTNMMAGAVDGGLAEPLWRVEAARVAAAVRDVRAEHTRGMLGFLDLPGNLELHERTRAVAERARTGTSDVVVLGIGGSALGPIALRTALLAPGWNTLGEYERGGYPRLHMLDNVDPRTIGALLDRLDLAQTLFVITSKSGGTAETMAQYLVVRAQLDAALGDRGRERLVFVTDPAKGALRALARQESITALDVPANVGGRFSVLAPVGLLPAALVGIDTGALLAGAGAMAELGLREEITANPPGTFALLQWLADTRLGRPIHVFMPYADSLRDMSGWFVQLWAESLGKRARDGRNVGPTPIAALGATDQHSQVQLFMEGPRDKTVTFLAVDEVEGEIEIPRLHADVPELAYLGGRRLGELLDIERQATAGALARRGRPNLTIRLERVDAWHVGALFMFLELATVIAGRLYDVDPMDQPGVELGKQFTYAMLGRPGSESARQEWELLPQSDSRWVL